METKKISLFYSIKISIQEFLGLKNIKRLNLIVFFLPFIFGLNQQLLSQVTWGEVLDTQSDHDTWVPGTNHPHFTKSWRTEDSWNGSEGYYRWFVSFSEEEDDDGYSINFPNTNSNSVYLSWMQRVGSTWWNHITAIPEEFKYVMFYPEETPPRPTLFSWHVRDGGNTFRYRTFLPAADANSEGHLDEFGDEVPGENYPNHSYKEDADGHNQWYWMVNSIEGNQTKLYIFSQDGSLSGLYATSENKTDGYVNETWNNAKLLAYIEETTAGDENSYMDIAHIMLSQTMPTVPSGFLFQEDETPPILNSATIPASGTTVRMNFSEAVTESGNGSNWSLVLSEGPVVLSSPLVNNNIITYVASRTILSGESLTNLDYSQPGNGIQDLAGNDLESVINFSGTYTNNSIQINEPVAESPDPPENVRISQ
jgi:hypothetical protein